MFVVVSAGNSPPGVQPSQPYPAHFDDPEWQLGAWARGFNSVTCGSLVKRLSVGGLVTTLGWPSPFTRVGPGLCNSPKPDFSDNGGNSTPAMQAAPGLGVWGLTASSQWEDLSGTSFAAPPIGSRGGVRPQPTSEGLRTRSKALRRNREGVLEFDCDASQRGRRCTDSGTPESWQRGGSQHEAREASR